MKGFFRKIWFGLKNFFSRKKNLLFVGLGIILIAIIVVLVIVLFPKEEENKEKFALDPIYDVYPEDVKKLYKYMVSVSCYGDLFFDIKVDAKATSILNLDKKVMTDYVFSYLDKEQIIKDKFDAKEITKAEKILFANELNLVDNLKKFSYGDYTYNLDGKTINRTKSECKSDVEYVSQLYGYSYNEKLLSVDVNMGYKKDDKIYSLDGKELGIYSKEEDLQSLYAKSSYYRFNFVLDGETYKLTSVEWKNKV